MTKQFVYGLHSVTSLLETHPERVIKLCVLKDRKDKKIDSLLSLAKQNEIEIQSMSRSELDQLAHEGNHQGVLAFCSKTPFYTEHDLKSLLGSLSTPPLVLILDGVQDPHNLGACFRTCDATGVNAIITPKDHSVGITPVVSKVASGATETIPFVQATNLVRALEELKELGFWIFGADAEAKELLFQADLSGPTAIVLGAEGKGLRRLTREHCDVLLKIPMQGKVSSLNVSVAASVFLFEAVRQRTKEMKS